MTLEQINEHLASWQDFAIRVSFNASDIHERPVVKTSEDAAAFLRCIWDQDLLKLQESFYALFFNQSHHLIGWRLIGIGSVNGVVVNIKLICAIAIHSMAQYVVVAHNHPSGDLNPSNTDLNMTIQIQAALKFFDTKLADHLIVGPDLDFMSFADNGLL